ncbi:hypothetical protein [Acidithrix ferrooxidans]|uniref:Uncharacterized protein n=1 Tax=Acidithrix ferrooxidans TaxID=1280514 RepID=A0A0D8HL95_9ACTN|nr:hypothetical protein [Acidithrix ferrooxidans]KJF18517.1 hypothetical protein AXFE_05970 [Acidithrix ferrooxidans]
MHSEDYAAPPWRLAADRPWYPHLALFVRDACLLEIPRWELYPPNLEGDLPDLRGLLDESMRSIANRQWVSWWGKIIDSSVRDVLVLQPQGSAAILRAMTQASDQFLARVTSSATDVSSEAAERMRLIIVEAQRWFYHRNGAVPDRPEGPMIVDWNLVSSVASDVLQGLGVQSKTVTVGVIQLDVLGSWSEVHDTGVLLGSKGFFRNEDRLRPMLTEAFHYATTAPSSPVPLLFEIPDEAAVRPKSQLGSPIVIASVDKATLILEEILRYDDGFEIHLQIGGDALPRGMSEILDDIRSKLAPNQAGRIDIFDGLQLEVLFLDGRATGTIEVPRFNDGRGDVISNRFFRPPNDPRNLWIWISPLPPLGQVQLNALWPRYGIINTSVSFNVL